MAQANLVPADFAYGSPGNDPVGLPLSVSAYADRAHLREVMREDAAAAGLWIAECGNLTLLLEGEARALGEVVLVDCPELDGAGLAALARLDLRAAHAGVGLVVSASVAGDDPQRIDLAGLDQPGRRHLYEIAGEGKARATNRDSLFS